jgi:1D-myo-inositol-tetrakisphosphate 5-kinase/inositol-polyphosphate multikinase
MLTQERREVVQRILKIIRRIQRLLEEDETRMYSTSLLLVYEGDPKALKLAKAEQKESPALLVDDEGMYELLDDDDDVDSDEDVDEDDGPDFLTCTASLIDFAHASFTPGKGPDENTLRGIMSTTKILQSILKS